MFSNIIYSLLATSTILSLSGIITNNKILASTGVVSFTSTAIVLSNKDKKQLQKLKKANSLSIKSQEYIDEQFNELKIALKNLSLQNSHYEKSIQELGTSYEQKFHIANQELANLQQQNKDCQLDFKALTLLCEQQVNDLKEDVTDKHRQIQKTIQSNKDQLNHRVNKVEEKLKENQPNIVAESFKKKQHNQLFSQPKSEVLELTLAQNLPRQPKTVIFIDQANFHHTCEEIGIEPDYKSLVLELMPEEGEFEIRIYIGVYEQPRKKQQDFSRELKNLGYKVFEIPIDQRRDGTKKVVGDDIKLTSDLVEMVSTKELTSQDKIVLVTDDGDYFPALEKVKQQDIDVTLIARRPSRHLNDFVNRRIYLEQIKYDICKYQKLDAA